VSLTTFSPGVGLAPLSPSQGTEPEKAIKREGLQACRERGSQAGHAPIRTQTARLHSLIELAKLRGVEPRAYPSGATRRAIWKPGTVTLPLDLK
jgi:hypothetical protein